ncbi:MAG: oxygen-independent coproporphyrinogen III oxidase, partial [Myxococcales bacterium]|nr:oxygen-independent coproporphyrinogen III oxidase [Myxococcales bacterium]
RHGVDFLETFPRALHQLGPMQADGLVQISSDQLRVSPKGRYLIRNIAMAFDAYLDMDENQYSRTL